MVTSACHAVDGLLLIVEDGAHQRWQREHGLYLLAELLLAQRLALRCEAQSDHRHRENLSGESFGRGDADLRPSVQVDPSVRLTSDRGANSVADAEAEATVELCEVDGSERVGRLAGLRGGGPIPREMGGATSSVQRHPVPRHQGKG